MNSQSPIIDRISEIRKSYKSYYTELIWCFINLFIVMVLYLEIKFGLVLQKINEEFPIIHLLDITYAFGTLFIINFIYHLMKYFSQRSVKPLHIFNKFAKFCKVSDNEPGFCVTSESPINLKKNTLEYTPIFSPSRFSKGFLGNQMFSPINSHPSIYTSGISSLQNSPNRNFTPNEYNLLSSDLHSKNSYLGSSFNELAFNHGQRQGLLSLDRRLSAGYSPINNRNLLTKNLDYKIDDYDLLNTSSLKNISALKTSFNKSECITDAKVFDQFFSEQLNKEQKLYQNECFSPNCQQSQFQQGFANGPYLYSPTFIRDSYLNHSFSPYNQDNNSINYLIPNSSNFSNFNYNSFNYINPNVLTHQFNNGHDIHLRSNSLSPHSAGSSPEANSRSIQLASQLSKYQYQLARPYSGTQLGGGIMGIGNDASDQELQIGSSFDYDIWSKLNVTEHQVDLWIERLRKYLGQTILARLVDEINSVNKAFALAGMEELKIGEVSLPNLRQIALNKSQIIPQLQKLLPFLEITTNQEYLIQRIKELSSGGSLSSFKWNSGGEFKGKKWEDNLVTDSAMILHFLCCYMDLRLPPHPRYPDGNVFSSQHLFKSTDKPNISELKESVYFYECSITPPHYKIIFDGTTCNLNPGRTNLFHAILLFFFYIKHKQHGMLKRVSLGLSGINILWIFED